MLIKYQFTIFSEKYKPVACIVEAENRQEFANKGKAYKDAVAKICIKRSWDIKDLMEYGYNTWKVRKVEETT